MRAPFSARDLQDMREIVFGITVSGTEDYVSDLGAAGFTAIAATDMTGDWTPFVAARLTAWRRNHAAYARTHGEAAWAAQEKFYAAVARLFESGSLGGVRLVARAA